MKDKTPVTTIGKSATELFAQLTLYSQDGILSSQELVQLAPIIFSGGDPALVPSLEAILPLKDSNPDEFNAALNIILSQRGLSTRITPEATNTPPPPSATTPNEQPKAKAQEHTEASKSEPILSAAAEEVPDNAGAEAESNNDDNSIKEIVVICIDVSGSMECPFEVDDDVRTIDRTRLQAVKQCFYGFRDQTQGHKNGSKHLLGLISFSNSVKVHTYPTSNLDVFEDVIDDMSPGGMTAIFEAISVACIQVLKPQSNLHPNADLRVLVLSDGLNNCQKVSANDALKALADVGAVCDCMILGDTKKSADNDLRKLVAASEGQCVQFTGLADAYEALESPAMISLASRRNCETHSTFDREAFRQKLQSLSTLSNVQAAPMQRGVVKAAPSAAAMTVSDPAQKVVSYIGIDANSAPLLKADSGRMKRVVKEMNDFVKAPLPNVFIYAGLNEEGNLTQSFKILMTGLDEHPIYKGRGFEISLELKADYPFSPPKFKCVTPIYHYAVTAEGAVCLPILHEAWSPSLSIKAVLETFSDLVHDYKKCDPNCNLALRSWLSDLLRTNPEAYGAESLKHTQDHALTLPAPKQPRGELTPNDFCSILGIN